MVFQWEIEKVGGILRTVDGLRVSLVLQAAGRVSRGSEVVQAE